MSYFLIGSVGFELHDSIDIIRIVGNPIMNIVSCVVVSGWWLSFKGVDSPFIEYDIFADSYSFGGLVPKTVRLLCGAVSYEEEGDTFWVKVSSFSFGHVNVCGGSENT